jgi:hypothetical protein
MQVLKEEKRQMSKERKKMEFSWEEKIPSLKWLLGISIFFAPLMLVVFFSITKVSVNTHSILPDNSVNLSDSLTQQANVISWFTLVSTIVLTFIVFIGGIGYFNTRDVKEKLTQLEEEESKFYDARNEFIKSEKDAKELADKLNPILVKFETGEKAINETEFPISIVTPTDDQRLTITDHYSKYLWLIIGGFETSPRGALLKSLYHFYKKEYDLAIESSRNYISKLDDDRLIIEQLRFIEAVSCVELKKYSDAAVKFLNIAKSNHAYLAASWNYINRCNIIADTIILPENPTAIDLILKYYALMSKNFFDEAKIVVEQIGSNINDTEILALFIAEIKVFELTHMLSNQNIDNSTEESQNDVDLTMEIENEIENSMRDVFEKGKPFKNYLPFEWSIYQDFINGHQIYLRAIKFDYGYLNN